MTRLKIAQVLVHEMLHFNSFISVETVPNDKADDTKAEMFKKRRIGLRIFIEGRGYGKMRPFHDINEAVTEELALRLFKQYEVAEMYPGELVQTKSILQKNKLLTNLIQEIEGENHHDHQR